MRVETLQEFESRNLTLTLQNVQDLVMLTKDKLSISPAPESGQWTITATQWVGTIVMSDLQILVRPKVNLENLFLLLGVGMSANSWRPENFAYASTRELLPAFAYFYARTLETTLTRGLIRHYRDENEFLPTLRGRVDITRQLRTPGQWFPLACRYPEFTSDIPENQILKAATLRLLCLLGITQETRRSLMRELVRFEEVSDLVPDKGFVDRIVFSRLNEHYRPALKLAELILLNSTLVDREGKADASAFLIDMNELFQRFITERLGRELGSRLRVEPEPIQWLGVGKKVEMWPDLVFSRKGRRVYVGDVKYKITTSGRARNADYYQLLAYATAMDLPEGVLVYCHVEKGGIPPKLVEVQHGAQRLFTYAIDLTGSPSQVVGEIRQLADWLHSRLTAESLVSTS